jgi:hypothetical protein
MRRHTTRAGLLAITVLAASLALASAPASASAGGTTLRAGEQLTSGQNLHNDNVSLFMQGDGNLVIYGMNMVAIWSSSTAPSSGARLVMQVDGNLVIYSATNQARWATNTAGHPGAWLALQGDGNLVVYSASNQALWSSNTAKRAFAVAALAFVGQPGKAQYDCLNQLFTHESGWNEYARNPSSGAYGIPQALPPEKMASAGADWRTNPRTQIAWGIGYIGDRYGTPCAAWSAWLSRSPHWY